MDVTTDPFTSEEICEQATGNAGALSLVLLAYARERGESLPEVARFAGRIFAPGWDTERGKGARVAARWAALNAVSCGSTLQRLTEDSKRASTTVSGWPTDEDLAFVGLSRDEADALFEVFDPIATRLGLRYSWRRDGDAVEMTFEETDT